jgi:hypothetical protein
MKKILLVLTLIYASTLVLFAQNLSLSYDGTTYNNGDTITYSSTDVTSLIVSHMWITNNATSNMKVRAKKVILDTVPGSENYFCWTSCYLPQVYIGDTLTIKAGETNKFNFSGDYEPYGNAGKSRIMYVFYNNADPNDSVAYIAEFNAGSGVGYYTLERVDVKLNVFPNPASNFINIDFNIPGNFSQAKFEIRNVLGSVVSQTNITARNGQMSIDVSNLQRGVYFYTLMVDEQAILSKKLVIK